MFNVSFLFIQNSWVAEPLIPFLVFQMSKSKKKYSCHKTALILGFAFTKPLAKYFLYEENMSGKYVLCLIFELNVQEACRKHHGDIRI